MGLARTLLLVSVLAFGPGGCKAPPPTENWPRGDYGSYAAPEPVPGAKRGEAAEAVPGPAMSRPEPVADPTPTAPSPRRLLRGVSLAGAEFGETLPGVHGEDYVYPVASLSPGYESPRYFVQKGMNAFRLPFRWERIQPVLGAELDPEELGRLTGAVRELRDLGATVILDLHNYGRYGDKVVGSAGLPVTRFADVWTRLARVFGGDGQVVFGLMGEPHDMPTEQWARAANVAIAAIRAAAAGNLVLVSGNGWSGAQGWAEDDYGTPNAVALLQIRDSANNLAFEAHQYFDADASGTSETCVNGNTAVKRLTPFTDWLRANGLKGYLGEFGAGDSAACLAALAAAAGHVEANSDVYVGWSYWAGGPWLGDYALSLEPDGGDAPQLRALQPYLTRPGS